MMSVAPVSESILAAAEEPVCTRSGAERRVHRRHSPAELEWIKKVRLKYGPVLSLVDLSSGGVQVEVEDHWLRPDSTVVVEIDKGESVLALPSRVVRCQVADVARSIRYRGALEFKRPLRLPEPGGRPGAAGGDATPLQAHARLVHALARLDDPSHNRSLTGPQLAEQAGVSTIGARAVAAAIATLDTAASRRAGLPFLREVTGLMNEVAEGIERRDTPQRLMMRLEQRLRKIIPARSIRVIRTSAIERENGLEDAIYFDAAGPTKILVEFAAHATPQEWQFQLLKASGHLVALITELEDRLAAPVVVPQPDAANGFGNWHKLVVRFEDGRLLKGYCQDFLPTRGHFHLYPSPTAGAETRVHVPVGYFKAVFFVRDFDGNSEYDDDKSAARVGHGRKVAITFLDDELLIGMTLNYRTDGAGFFVTPCDEKSNNLRIFVSRHAVRHVRFV